MSIDKEENTNQQLYKSKCGYFDDLYSYSSIFLFPTEEYSMTYFHSEGNMSSKMLQQLFYAKLLDEGYRRSNDTIYNNICPQCQKCIPLRIPTGKYLFNKKERYLIKKNKAIFCKITDRPEDFITNEKIELMQMYNKRHDSSANDTFLNVKQQLFEMNGLYMKGDNIKSIYSGTKNIDYYLNNKLIGCSIADFANNAISSNYFYYNIEEEYLKMSLGSFSILTEINYCKKNNIKYYYLGYWIDGCKKMSYKANFKPHQIRKENTWIDIE